MRFSYRSPNVLVQKSQNAFEKVSLRAFSIDFLTFFSQRESLEVSLKFNPRNYETLLPNRTLDITPRIFWIFLQIIAQHHRWINPNRFFCRFFTLFTIKINKNIGKRKLLTNSQYSTPIITYHFRFEVLLYIFESFTAEITKYF